MDETTDWTVRVRTGGSIEIHHETYGSYGFHPLDLSVEDRMTMIRALTLTKEHQMKEINETLRGHTKE